MPPTIRARASRVTRRSSTGPVPKPPQRLKRLPRWLRYAIWAVFIWARHKSPQGNFVRSWGSSLYSVLYIFETLWRHTAWISPFCHFSILSHQPAHQKMTVKSLGTHPYERGQGLTCQQTHLGPNHFQLSNERSLEMAQFQSPFQPHRCEICKTSGATAFIFFLWL